MILVSTVMAARAAEEPFAVNQTQENAQTQADLPALVKANNTFGFDLHSQLRRAPGNTFLSPFSLSTALAMTAAGARGETARQMAGVLHFPFGPDRLDPAFASLIRSVRPGPDDAARAAPHRQRPLGAAGLSLPPRVRRDPARPLRCHVRRVDFRDAVEDARKTINTWAEKKTEGKIQDLIASGVLDSSTRLVLTNAIYFKGGWSEPFRRERTRDEDFHLNADRTVRVPLMHQSGRFAYSRRSCLPDPRAPLRRGGPRHGGRPPQEGRRPARGREGADGRALRPGSKRLEFRQVDVALPRFKLTALFELSQVLAAMGMALPFSDRADFSGINGGKEPLQISAVIHKAYVDVNEAGTEAAAATAIGIRATSVMIPQPPTPFRADHPFLFLIRDRRTGSILFLGCLTRPEG